MVYAPINPTEIESLIEGLQGTTIAKALLEFASHLANGVKAASNGNKEGANFCYDLGLGALIAAIEANSISHEVDPTHQVFKTSFMQEAQHRLDAINASYQEP